MTTFSGYENHSASELRDHLAQWEPSKDVIEAISDLTGAIMCLCNAVNILEGRVCDLEEGDNDHDYT